MASSLKLLVLLVAYLQCLRSNLPNSVDLPFLPLACMCAGGFFWWCFGVFGGTLVFCCCLGFFLLEGKKGFRVN